MPTASTVEEQRIARTFSTDLDIARAAKLQPIVAIARSLGIEDNELDLYGSYKAKISLNVLDRLGYHPDGKLPLSPQSRQRRWVRAKR